MNALFTTRKIVSCFESAAEEKLPELKREKLNAPWHHDQKLRTLREKKDLKRSTGSASEIKEIQDQTLTRTRQLRNQFYADEANKINQYAINRQIALFKVSFSHLHYNVI